MANKGKLFLIPNSIAEQTHDKTTTPQLRSVLPDIRFFLAENVRSARRFLSSLKVYDSIESLNFEVLDKDTQYSALTDLMAPIARGENMGVISESGCPGVADPGALAVKFAHEQGIPVVPITGPSSILLALMASGLNGQKFAFQGYLPIDQKEAVAAIKLYEKESQQKGQTQIFIETPYRNNQIAQTLIKNLSPQTRLTIALDITGLAENIVTKSVQHWRGEELNLQKMPAVFLFLAS